MSQLPKNFKDEEFACNCGCKRSFVDPRLAKGLQELRDLVKVPIKILSGYRCIQSNLESGGGANSQHLYGKASDISIHGMSVVQMYEAALQIHDFFEGGIGVYPDNGFGHVDVRNGKARWGRIGKGKKAKYVSIDEALKKGNGK